MCDVAELKLEMRSGARLAFNTLLQRGFYLTGPDGLSVREFLRRVVGYDDECIDGQVRTIFLNSSPMDGIDETHVKDGDRLSLGSAMPGLVGICMGRDNPYKSFRSDLSCDKDEEVGKGGTVRVMVKVFSVLAVDTGADILAAGIEMDGKVLADLLEKEAGNFVACAGKSAQETIAFLRSEAGTVKVAVVFS